MKVHEPFPQVGQALGTLGDIRHEFSERPAPLGGLGKVGVVGRPFLRLLARLLELVAGELDQVVEGFPKKRSRSLMPAST